MVGYLLIEVADPSGLEDDDWVAFLADYRASFPFHHEGASVRTSEFLRLFDGARLVSVDDGFPDLDGLSALIGDRMQRC